MIEGRIVNLRPWEMSDLDRFYSWINDPEVTEHLAMRYLMSLAAEEEFVRARASAPVSYDNVHFAIETKDAVHIGSIGFHQISPEDRKARLGVTIGDKNYWSKGYGTDALMTLLRFAFDEMNLNRVDLLVDEDNPRAIASYRKCGFVEEARMRQERFSRGTYHDQLVMGILRDEFYARA